jgi:pimeloyl-ACP methyl ester carboxylesterase
MATFALVHGGYHGAWCWDRLAPLLRDAGHDVVVMDLPLEDGTATFDDLAGVVCTALEGCGDDVVLVGHSYAGNIVPLVAARRPVRHLVYLAAMIPEVGRSLAEQLGDAPEMLNPCFIQGLSMPDEQLCQEWTDLDLARSVFYADCDERTAQAAVTLLRPQSVYPALHPFSLSEFPSVRTTYICCDDDQMLRPKWSRHNVQRLDADIVEMPGGHSPFLARPSELAEVLLRLTG